MGLQSQDILCSFKGASGGLVSTCLGLFSSNGRLNCARGNVRRTVQNSKLKKSCQGRLISKPKEFGFGKANCTALFLLILLLVSLGIPFRNKIRRHSSGG